MMHFLAEYGLFLAKSITLVAAILIIAGMIMGMILKHRKVDDKQLDITPLNQEYEEMENILSNTFLSDVELKQKRKLEKRKTKQEAKAQKKKGKAGKTATQDDAAAGKKLFVIDFDGDIRATAVASMRQEISAILTLATENDEVLVRLESGGGTVHGYGLAASQLQRIRNKGIPLTVSVDKIAASGGYMMACVANQIIAAPFAIIGSIGVLAQIPNVHRLLKKNDVDFEQLQAGEHKRTLTVFGENTDKARAKMQQELEETHTLFKDFIKVQRPALDVETVATGEHWLGTKALELGLVDALQTSDDYLMAALKEAKMVHLHYSEKKKFMEKLSSLVSLRGRHSHKALETIEKPLLM